MNCLIVGGAYQGKRAFAQKQFALQAADFADGAVMELTQPPVQKAVCNVSALVRRALEQGVSNDILLRLLAGKIVLCDEVGCGVVPIEPEQDRWREAVGRLCCDLAERADTVYWMRAGIAQQIKGG